MRNLEARREAPPKVALELNREVLAQGGALQGVKSGEVGDVSGEGCENRLLRYRAGAVDTCDGGVRLAVPGVGESGGSVEHSIPSSKAAVKLGAARFEAGDARCVAIALGSAGSDGELNFVETCVVCVLYML